MADGIWLVDGGLSNPVPVSVARAMRADASSCKLNNDMLNDRAFGAHIARNFKQHQRSLYPVRLARSNSDALTG